MSSKANSWESGLLALLFDNTDYTDVGDAGGLRGSVSYGSLYVSLHTASPGEGGTQSTNEIAYTSYARQGVARDGVAWALGNPTYLNVDVTFPKGTGGSGTATYVGIGTSSSGAGKLLYYAALTTAIVCGNGVTPKLPNGLSWISED